MIPIYRAKKIDSDEWVEGYYQYIEFSNKHLLNCNDGRYDSVHEIDISTLSIHFTNMIDKNGKKVFASLSEDGVGGDDCSDEYNEKYICIFNKTTNSCVMAYHTKQLKSETMGIYDHYWKTFEVIGIHKGE